MSLMVSRRCLSHLRKDTPAHFQFPNKAGRRKWGGAFKMQDKPTGSRCHIFAFFSTGLSVSKPSWNGNFILKKLSRIINYWSLRRTMQAFFLLFTCKLSTTCVYKQGDFQQISSCAIKWYMHFQAFLSRWEHPAWLSEELSSMDRWVAGIHSLRSVFAILLVFM